MASSIIPPSEPNTPILSQLWPWQHAQWQQLVKQMADQRLAHAYVLSGPAGLGKLNFANYVAQALLCQRNQHQTTLQAACNQCSACHQFLIETHPDCYRISPEPNQIKIEQIRSLCDMSHTSHAQGGYRVIIIEAAHCLNQAASNALLKYLEEPGANTVLLLVTEQPAQLLPTILSRCLTIAFKPVSEAEFHAFYQTQTALLPEALLYQLCLAAPLRAVTLAQQHTQRIALIQIYLASLAREALPSQELNLGGLTLVELISLWQTVLLDLLKIHCQAPATVLNSDCRQNFINYTQKISREQVLTQLTALNDYKKLALTGIALNERLFLDSLLLTAYGHVRSPQ